MIALVSIAIQKVIIILLSLYSYRKLLLETVEPNCRLNQTPLCDKTGEVYFQMSIYRYPLKYISSVFSS